MKDKTEESLSVALSAAGQPAALVFVELLTYRHRGVCPFCRPCFKILTFCQNPSFNFARGRPFLLKVWSLWICCRVCLILREKLLCWKLMLHPAGVMGTAFSFDWHDSGVSRVSRSSTFPQSGGEMLVPHCSLFGLYSRYLRFKKTPLSTRRESHRPPTEKKTTKAKCQGGFFGSVVNSPVRENYRDNKTSTKSFSLDVLGCY